MNKIDVDITIKDTATGTYVRLPVIPETLPYSCGEAIYDAIKVLNLGTVEFFSGVELDSMAWDCFFPARYDAGYCKHSDLSTPLEYRDQFEAWKNQGTVVQLIIPALKLNKAMKVVSFTPELKGAEGDIYYNVQLREHKDIRPIQVDVAAAADGTISISTKPSADARPPVPQKATPKSYTVQKGDTLVHISKKLPLADGWRPFYEKNKTIIGPDPNKLAVGLILRT